MCNRAEVMMVGGNWYGREIPTTATEVEENFVMIYNVNEFFLFPCDTFITLTFFA